MRETLESAIQRRVKKALERQGCHVEVITCSAYQRGIPDLYVFYPPNHHWWVDVKREKGGVLTKAQVQKWSLWETIGLGVWILYGTEKDPLGFLMNNKTNWRDLWKPRYEKWLCSSPADLLRESNDAE